MSHAITRTSPFGGPFIGRCIKCGANGLGLGAPLEDCPADGILSDEQALLKILGRPDEPTVLPHHAGYAEKSPDRIWVDEAMIQTDDEGSHVTGDPEGSFVEYVRADLLPPPAVDYVAGLEAALKAMLQSVCGPTGFAEAVRHNSGHAYPWHSLDAADAARAALSTPATEPQGYVEGLRAASARCKLEAEICRNHDPFRNEAPEIYFDGLQDAQIIIDRLADEASRPAPQPAAEHEYPDPLIAEDRYEDDQPAADTRVTDAMIEKATMVLLGKDEDPAPGVDWHCARDWTVSQVRTKMGQAIRAIIGTATPAPSDKIAEAAQDKTAAELVIDAYDAANPFRQADMHPALCHCNRCAIDWMRALAGKGE